MIRSSRCKSSNPLNKYACFLPSDPWKTNFFGLVFVGRMETVFSHFAMQTPALSDFAPPPPPLPPRNTPGIEIKELLIFAKIGEMYRKSSKCADFL